MTRTLLSYKIIWLTSLAALLLIGCSSTPQAEFYTLNSISMPQTTANSVVAGQPVSVGVGPVAIPEVLDRPQIVTRTGPNKLRIDEFHRWAGRLDEDFARVLAENISLLLPTEQVAVFPWDVSFDPRYQVALNILRFEGRWGKDVLLEVFWKIIDPQKQTALRVQKSVIKEPLADENYEALIAIKSRMVEILSNQIINEINNLNINN